MDRFAELDLLTSEQLHDRAVSYARRHLDVKFFWELLRTIPAAFAAAGNNNESEEDIQHVSALVADAFESDEGELAESLRPFYLDYLQRPPKA